MSNLTPRQRSILEMRASGLTAPEIAKRLGVSLQTVKNHTGQAYLTLGVRNHVEAFIVLGWLRPPSSADGILRPSRIVTERLEP